MIIELLLFFISELARNMQFENGLNKWNGRVPPLDLSNVSVCPRETEQRWHDIIKPKSRKMVCDRKKTSDGLPIGMQAIFSFFLCSLNSQY